MTVIRPDLSPRAARLSTLEAAARPFADRHIGLSDADIDTMLGHARLRRRSTR